MQQFLCPSGDKISTIQLHSLTIECQSTPGNLPIQIVWGPM